MSPIDKARSFAKRAHESQTYGDGSFFENHLEVVFNVALEFGFTAADVLVAVYLHDVVEDTTTSLLSIDDAFGPTVSRIIGFVTDEPGATRKERKARTYRKWRDGLRDPEPFIHNAITVKLLDRIANLRSSKGDSCKLKMYRREATDFRNALDVGHPDHAPLWREIDALLA